MRSSAPRRARLSYLGETRRRPSAAAQREQDSKGGVCASIGPHQSVATQMLGAIGGRISRTLSAPLSTDGG